MDSITRNHITENEMTVVNDTANDDPITIWFM